ncbi:MAG: lipoyl(octanoyl) transferase LipB [Bacteroides sp.]|nr:MAG: lipoyl(octanoyl) transferase LipB [Bacteroides sp.]
MYNIILQDWRYIEYLISLKRQENIFNKKLYYKKLYHRYTLENYIIFCEHNHVYTLGSNGNISNLLVDLKQLNDENIKIYNLKRGGDITYHGPGQLVCYLILDLELFQINLHQYIRIIEKSVILTLQEYNISCKIINNFTGVWTINNKKICSIGIYCRRWITMHGFSININNDNKYFDNIIACGINNIKMTSISSEIKRNINIDNFKKKLLYNFYKLLCNRNLNTSYFF